MSIHPTSEPSEVLGHCEFLLARDRLDGINDRTIAHLLRGQLNLEDVFAPIGLFHGGNGKDYIPSATSWSWTTSTSSCNGGSIASI